jgi:hypothetical protein
MKRSVTVILLSLGMMFFSCCGCNDLSKKTITYEVTGTPPQDVMVDFHDEFGNLDRFNSIALPWVKTFNVQHRGPEYHGGNHPNGMFTAYISATSATIGRAVNLTVAIYVCGKLVKTVTTREANRAATAYYQVRL